MTKPYPSKLVRLHTRTWPLGGYGHWCPACNAGHEINCDTPNYNGSKWSFDGNAMAPTFSPSINIRWGKYASDGQGHYECGGICHYFITAGRIIYCGDCTHALKGQTVDLPNIPYGKYLGCEMVLPCRSNGC